ncbi:zinc-binding oxidoreductase-like protein ToxD [Aaosphaeria arxii CBS 175.79]|uniref:Zinc-binding oxidoreductase-like protein ToxD n=1 Tax=Aaosphaeria arxii CBS 175.79 TaxID=1450172 RepID=A0A6A5XC61_9PLEO|nr:zinc-binding oxidoreductase-like protein ToxD [Aaosphaeria arxii CBS 175.79]KAF2010548.1 zinc-binding oxidoreductase-like protein ToxD [Aaosphaeria arxii CBS 175.79]
MKEAHVSKGPVVKIVDSPIPEPEDDQVLIQVVVSGSNPKDWKVPQWLGDSNNGGDDIAGIVHSVGKNVWDFKKGDRVASFHEMRTKGGSYAEYALGWSHSTFLLPNNVSFEEAATLPLAAMTAAIGLFLRLKLPQPWVPKSADTGPLVVYGGASAVGAYAIKLAKQAGIHPIIAVAGRGIPYVEKLIDRSKGDTVIDYRQDDSKIVSDIRSALNGQKLWYAFDAVSEHGSYGNIVKVLEEKGGKITFVLPGKNYEGIPEGVEQTITSVGSTHSDAKDFAYVWFRYLARGLAEGWFTPHPFEVVSGGLAGLQGALENLRDGKASATKYVFRIADTEGAGQSKL